jgi:hypothetical protein
MEKRSLIIMMLIGLLSFGMVTGCNTGTNPGNDDDKKGTVTKVIEEKYRGTWNEREPYPGQVYKFILSENRAEEFLNDEPLRTHENVYTGIDQISKKDIKLYRLNSAGQQTTLGTFENDKTLTSQGVTYIKED